MSPPFRFAFAAGLLFASGAPLQAQQRYDGLWSVMLTTTRGTCDDRTLAVMIRDGRLSQAGAFGFITASGGVSERGRLDANVGAAGIVASARGRLGGQQGRGTWFITARDCMGRWTAQRQA